MALVGVITGAVLTGVFAFAIARWQHKEAARLAEEQRIRSCPDLRLRVFGHNTERISCFILLHPGSTHDCALCTIPFVIENASEVGCEDAILSVQGSKICIDNHARFTRGVPGVLKHDVQRSVVKVSAGFKNVSYKCPPIPPRAAVGLSDQFFFPNLFWRPIEAPVTFADGAKADVTVRLHLSMPLTLSVLSMKAAPLSHALQWTVAAVGTIEEFLQKVRAGDIKLETLFRQHPNGIAIVQADVVSSEQGPEGQRLWVMAESYRSIVVTDLNRNT